MLETITTAACISSSGSICGHQRPGDSAARRDRTRQLSARGLAQRGNTLDIHPLPVRRRRDDRRLSLATRSDTRSAANLACSLFERLGNRFPQALQAWAMWRSRSTFSTAGVWSPCFFCWRFIALAANFFLPDLWQRAKIALPALPRRQRPARLVWVWRETAFRLLRGPGGRGAGCPVLLDRSSVVANTDGIG